MIRDVTYESVRTLFVKILLMWRLAVPGSRGKIAPTFVFFASDDSVIHDRSDSASERPLRREWISCSEIYGFIDCAAPLGFALRFVQGGGYILARRRSLGVGTC